MSVFDVIAKNKKGYASETWNRPPRAMREGP